MSYTELLQLLRIVKARKTACCQRSTGSSSISRENEGTETESQGVGRDMSCPRKLFLDERKSLF